MEAQHPERSSLANGQSFQGRNWSDKEAGSGAEEHNDHRAGSMVMLRRNFNTNLFLLTPVTLR